MGKKTALSLKLQSYQVVMLGLDWSGKTSILNVLANKYGEVDSVDPEPTLGFKVDVAKLNRKVPLIVWEIGGKQGVRATWPAYLAKKEAVVFVVDSSDTERMEEAKRELKTVLSAGECYGVPLLLLFHKQDRSGAQTVEELVEVLEIEWMVTERQWLARGTSTSDKDGIKEAFKDLYKLIKQRNRRGI